MTTGALVTGMDALHDAIDNAMRAHFGIEAYQYGSYSPQSSFDGTPIAALQTPALIFEVTEFYFDDDERDAAGRLLAHVSLAIHCVLSIKTDRMQQTLPQLAAAVAALVLKPTSVNEFIRGNTWGLKGAVGLPERVEARPSEFAPELAGRDAYTVSWEQTVYIDTTAPF